MDRVSTAAPTRLNARALTIILLATVWHVLLAVYLVGLSLDILRADTLFIAGKSADLGRPVQLFAGVFLLVPAVLAVLSSVLMVLRRGAGRYLALGVDLAAFALSLFALFGVWGLYGSFESIVDGVMRWPYLTLGFALAYVLYYVAGQLEEGGAVAKWLRRRRPGHRACFAGGYFAGGGYLRRSEPRASSLLEPPKPGSSPRRCSPPACCCGNCWC